MIGNVNTLFIENILFITYLLKKKYVDCSDL
nr:hypothetical protein [Mucilaginibacter sp. SP1R1]